LMGIKTFQWPVPSAHVLTDGWGWRSKHPVSGEISYHKGIDIGGRAYEGDSIKPFAEGEVVESVNNVDSRGKYITLKHNIPGKGIFYTSYCHLQSRTASLGSTVKLTDEVGKLGNTGGSTGPHLHFEFWRTSRASYNINSTNTYVSTDTRSGKNPNPQPLFVKSGSNYIYNTKFDWNYSERPLPAWYSHDEIYLRK